MTPSISANNHYFSALTGVRAVAAAMVFFFHFNPMGTGGFGWDYVNTWHTGVGIFFTLSGFLITHRYLDRVELSWPWAQAYFQNRFARIYPIFLVLTLLSFTLYQWGGAPFALTGVSVWYTPLDKVISIILNLTLTRAFFADMLFVGLPTAWSLTVEESFYLSAPFLLWAINHRVKAWPLFPVALLLIGLLLVAIMPSFGLPYHPLGNLDYMIHFTYFGNGFAFFSGICLSLWLKRHPQPAATSWQATAIGLLSIIACQALMVWSPNVDNAWSWPMRLLNNAVLPITVSVFFYGLIQEPTRLRRLLATPIMDLLGKSSYAFYLLHLGVIDTAFRYYVSDHIGLRFVAYWLLAIVLYKAIEHPAHKLLRSYTPARPAAVRTSKAIA